MKRTCVLVALSAGVAVGLAFAPVARAEGSAQQADDPAQQQSASEPAANEGQARIADATLRLEKAFGDQFVQGSIDRSALSEPIDAVVQAMPEAVRPKVQEHIDQVIQSAVRLASQMTPAERTAAATAPPLESLGKTQQAQIAGFGWPAAAGWGGLGAFGFPGYGTGYSTGYGTSCGYTSQSVNGWGYANGGCIPYGYGYGF